MEQIASPQEVRLHFVDYWRVVKTRWAIVLVVFLLVVMTTGIVTYFQPRIYASSARIKVEPERPTVAVFEHQPYIGYDPYFLQTQYEIIQSQKVLYPVIERLGLQKVWGGDLPVEAVLRRLKSQMAVRRYRDTSLIEVAIFDEDPARAAEIANTVAEVFERERLEVKREQTLKGLEKLREELTQQQERLKKAQDKVEQIRSELQVPVFGGIKLSDETVRHLEGQLTQSRVEAVGREMRLKELKKLNQEQLRNAISTIINDPNVGVLEQQRNATEVQLDQLKETYGPDHPQVRAMQATYDRLREQLEARLEGVMRGFEVDYQMAQARVDELQKQLDLAKNASVVLESERFRPFRNAQMEEEMETRLYEALKQRLQQTSIELEVPRSPVEVIDRAEAIRVPVRPNLWMNITLGAVAGLVLGIALTFFMEFLDTSVKRMEDVERYLGLPALGIVAQEAGLLSTGAASVAHIEAYRMLRTNVEFAKGDESINSFCVLSSGAGEGKSFTVSNLACVYAQHGSRVLVVDSDLRRPNIHKMFNLPNEAGIAEYLIGSKTLEEVIQPTSVANVWVITAGTRSDAKAALPLLSGQRMTDLIQELGRRYQVVLYDTPPVLGASDAAVLAREIGLSILVVQHRRYPRTMPRRARQIIENAGGKILGVVVNNVNLGQADTYYYYHDQYEYYLRAPDRRLHVAGAKGKPEEEGIKFTEKY